MEKAEEVKGKEHLVCRLKMYGLKQAPWYKK